MNGTYTRLFRQARYGPFTESVRSIEGRAICVLHKRFAEDVRREALCDLDVANRVFHGASFLEHRDADKRRIMRDLV